jgi:hypothetical protein
LDIPIFAVHKSMPGSLIKISIDMQALAGKLQGIEKMFKI